MKTKILVIALLVVLAALHLSGRTPTNGCQWADRTSHEGTPTVVQSLDLEGG